MKQTFLLSFIKKLLQKQFFQQKARVLDYDGLWKHSHFNQGLPLNPQTNLHLKKWIWPSKTLRILLSWIFILISTFSFGQILDPVKWNFELKKINDTIYAVVGKATMEKGWHLYSQHLPEGNIALPTRFEFEKNDNIELIGSVEEKSEIIEKEDPAAGAMSRFFANEALFEQRIKVINPNTIIKGFVEFMACDEEQCIPPTEHNFELSIQNQSTLSAKTEETPIKNLSLWAVILEAILWGFAALLTPCVFPMVPMTVSFFIKDTQNKLRAKINAGFFGISIVALYTLPIAAIIFITYFFGGESVTADIFNWLSTHWIPNILFFLIFMLFAASFFGAFEIVLPNWMVSKADSKADRGGLIGSFFMALTLVLVSFSCTGPIVGTIIVKSTQGEIWEPVVTMLAFSFAFAMPFTLLAFFPAWLKNMPKSGGWLNSVKVVLGFIEVALGLKFLSVADQVYHWGILDREVYLSIWIVTFTLLGFYLLGKLKFKHDSDSTHIGVPRLFMAIATFSFVLYMIPGLWGAPLKMLSGYLPPQNSLDFDLNRIIRENAMNFEKGTQPQTINFSNEMCEKPKYGDLLHLPHGLQGYFDYQQGLECARQLGKPIFIDITGHGCVNCREMEANVWSDPRVQKILHENYVIIALYVDDKTELPESEWIVSQRDGKVKKTIGKKWADFQITRYNVNAQPYYILLDHKENLLMPPRAYNLNVDQFIEFLKEGVKKFESSKQK